MKLPRFRRLFLLQLLFSTSFALIDQDFLNFMIEKFGSHYGHQMARHDIKNGSFGGGRGGERHTPVVLVHGLSHSAFDLMWARDNFNVMGIPKNLVFATSYGQWPGLSQTLSCDYIVQIRQFITAVHEYTKSDVDVIGYSMGSPIARKAIMGGRCVENGQDLGPQLNFINTYISAAGANMGSSACAWAPFGICNHINGLFCGSTYLNNINSRVGYEGKHVYAIHSSKDEWIGDWTPCGKSAALFRGAKVIKYTDKDHYGTMFGLQTFTDQSRLLNQHQPDWKKLDELTAAATTIVPPPSTTTPSKTSTTTVKQTTSTATTQATTQSSTKSSSTTNKPTTSTKAPSAKKKNSKLSKKKKQGVKEVPLQKLLGVSRSRKTFFKNLNKRKLGKKPIKKVDSHIKVKHEGVSEGVLNTVPSVTFDESEPTGDSATKYAEPTEFPDFFNSFGISVNHEPKPTATKENATTKPPEPKPQREPAPKKPQKMSRKSGAQKNAGKKDTPKNAITSDYYDDITAIERTSSTTSRSSRPNRKTTPPPPSGELQDFSNVGVLIRREPFRPLPQVSESNEIEAAVVRHIGTEQSASYKSTVERDDDLTTTRQSLTDDPFAGAVTVMAPDVTSEIVIFSPKSNRTPTASHPANTYANLFSPIHGSTFQNNIGSSSAPMPTHPFVETNHYFWSD